MQNDSHPVVETTLPPAWEQTETFADQLHDWMSSAPWLLISAAAHAVAIFLIAAIPWNLFERSEETVITSDVVTPTPTAVEEPPPEKEPEIVETPVEEDVRIPDFETADHAEVDTDSDFESLEGDAESDVMSPFDAVASTNNVIGIGNGASGGPSGRLGGRQNLGGGDRVVEPHLNAALTWLARHQSPDGHWDVDGYWADNVAGGTTCSDGAGSASQDVGMTGLALLAFLGDGHTLRQGEHSRVVLQGVRWLLEQQDPETGLIGEALGHGFLYDHGIATLALCEAYYFGHSPLLKSPAQRAVNYIARARNPYGAWRYDVPPMGDSDTSVTGWMVFALKSAEEAGLKTDRSGLVGALNWIDEVTDPSTGRVGYDSLGSVSSRIRGVNDHYPAEKGEAMTAVGLLCRFFLGQDPDDQGVMRQHADLLARTPPEWDPEGLGCDMYYWYYGTYAMYQMGGRHWKEWNRAMKAAVLDSQRRDGDYEGSWDPVGPWGHSGGRVYSTAMMALCLEVYFRYARVLGAR